MPRVDSLTVQQMQTFCHVYECGGYASASETLGMAGPTIWEQVKTLEKIYRSKLFERSGRNIVPTASGEMLYEMLRPLLATVSSTFDRLAEQDEGLLPQITLVTGARMMMDDLGAPFKRFQGLYPDTTLQIKTADNLAAQQIILDSRADLALMIEPPQDFRRAGIQYETLYPLEYLIALPARHRLIGSTHVGLAELVEEPIVVGSPHTIGRKLLDQTLFRLGISAPLNIVAETDNSAATLACVRAGLGIGIIAGRADGQLTRQIKTSSLAHELGKVNVVAAFREGRKLTNALGALVDLIRDSSQ
ncbi:LysR family transcriptional regulator [Allorhodopirellula solitaria]|uniref:HTH-type transcriptional activator CmpR n=1 Tax=Allorhodopirellula solitaria TaxID=2527987 RepID=A0A5C5WXG8_9BACT|nr:LysR family transcriptional regulator [Allorhodopirellula solitaria]TWT55357.1 HTH-type transcriptional activator CmpR [Allorhodopirellula solitaria]